MPYKNKVEVDVKMSFFQKPPPPPPLSPPALRKQVVSSLTQANRFSWATAGDLTLLHSAALPPRKTHHSLPLMNANTGRPSLFALGSSDEVIIGGHRGLGTPATGPHFASGGFVWTHYSV